jgi:hypothetical protein
MDTISMTLYKQSVPNTDLMAEISPYLTSISGEGISYGIPTIYGKLKNLDISITNQKINIKNGSLSKYFVGNNIVELSRSGTQKAIECLSDTLHLPIEKAIVKKFHYGINVMLANPPEMYYNYLGNCGKYSRLSQPNGINYKARNREFTLYDKIKEVKHHRGPIPPLYKNRHILRLESRFNNGINQYFNKAQIEANLLFNEDFYTEIIKDLNNTYQQINKIKTFKIDMTEITTKKEMQRLGVLSLIELEGGLLQALENIKERYKNGQLTKKQHFDLKVLYTESSKMKLQTMESPLIIELNQKIKEKFKYYI